MPKPMSEPKRRAHFAPWTDAQLANWWNGLGKREGDRVKTGRNKGLVKLKLIGFSDEVLAEVKARDCRDLLDVGG
jgi:hypothetical protein